MARNRPYDETSLILIHCSATPPSMDIGAKEIDGWHMKRGIYTDRGLTGYHYIIRRGGGIEQGRDLREIGAHAHGFNDFSVGVCLVGGVARDADGQLWPEDNFTPEQFESLRLVLDLLRNFYPTALVAPHSMVSTKACPSFDVYAWLGEEGAEELARAEVQAIIDARE